jgi:predicted dehydrogenase
VASARQNRNDPVRIGMVGAGVMGQIAHLANYATLPRCRVVALAELRPGLRGKVAARYGIDRHYATHVEMLRDADIDAVVAITRAHHSAPVALDVLRAKRPVLTEKPMAATLDQAERLLAAANQANVLHAVGFMRRHDPGAELAKRLFDQAVASGELGRILLMRCHCFGGNDYFIPDSFIQPDEPRPEDVMADWPDAPDWLDRDLAPAYRRFANIYVHDINLLRWFGGRTPAVTHVDYRKGGSGVVVLDFGNFPATLEFGEVTQPRWDEGLTIQFERGHIKLDLPPALMTDSFSAVECYRADTASLDRPPVPPIWAFRRQAEAYVDSVADGRPFVQPGADAIEDIRVLDRIWRRIA